MKKNEIVQKIAGTKILLANKNLFYWGAALGVAVFSYNAFVGKSISVFPILQVQMPIKISQAKDPVQDLILEKNSKRPLQKKYKVIPSSYETIAELFKGSELKLYDASNTENIVAIFKKNNYNIDNSQKVPKIQPSKIPENLKNLTNSQQRKKLFIEIMLPLIIQINTEMRSQANQLKKITRNYKKNSFLAPSERIQLINLSKKFRVRKPMRDIDKTITILQDRIGEIPPSMVIAQAALESGWGTSRFSNYNALFGQWTYDKNVGIIPNNREADKNHYIQHFVTPYKSMQSYVLNINSHNSYKRFRMLRKSKNKTDKDYSSSLVSTLIFYSEEKEDYIKKINNIISTNNLEKLNKYTLR